LTAAKAAIFSERQSCTRFTTARPFPRNHVGISCTFSQYTRPRSVKIRM
jgi:hypothetical protein